MTSTNSNNSPEALPYESYPRPQCTPAHLATIGRLFGLETPAIARTRVLEIGCSSGGNIIPLAERFPESTFLGIDLDARAIEQGRETAARLGLPNVAFEVRDGTAFEPGQTTFGYVLCHGLFSWIPPGRQPALLDTIRTCLDSDGLAYISYNTNPGWHLRAGLREMMRYHTRHFLEGAERVEQAKAFMGFLAREAKSGSERLDALLAEEAEHLARQPAYYVSHEYLGGENHPLYFHEMHALLESRKLIYVGEAHLGLMTGSDLGKNANRALDELFASRVDFEQYLDFLRMRRFRESIITHAGRTVSYPWRMDVLEECYFGSALEPLVPDPPLENSNPLRFTHPKAGEITVSEPLVKAVLLALRERWPELVGWRELIREASARAKMPDPGEVETADALMTVKQALEAALIETSIAPNGCSTLLAATPWATATARDQAFRGVPVTTFRHSHVRLDPLHRAVLCALDGSNDRAAIAARAREFLADPAFGALASERGVRIDEDLVARTLEGLVSQGLLGSRPGS